MEYKELFFICFILIPSLYQQKGTLPIFSLDNNPNITSDISNFFINKSLLNATHTTRLEVTIKDNNIVGDYQLPFLIELPIFNGELSIGSPKFMNAFRDNASVTQRSYINISDSSKNIISSDPDWNQNNLIKENSTEVIINCSYYRDNLSVSASISNKFNSINITKIVHYSFISLCLENKTVKVLNVYNHTINLTELPKFIEDFNEDFSHNFTDVDNIFIVTNETEDPQQSYLGICKTNKWTFYRFEKENRTYSNFSLEQYIINDYQILEKCNQTKKVAFSKKWFIVLLGNKTLIKSNSPPSKEINKYEYIVDFVVNFDYLIAATNKSILIINLENNETKNISFDNYQIMELDLFKSPFYPRRFLGVFFNQTENNSIFFSEFLIDNNDLLINKVFISKKANFSSISFDKFFTFFFDRISNIIYIIRRGLFNPIPFESYITYELTKYDNITENAQLSTYYNNKTNKQYLMLLSGNNTFYFSTFDFPRHYLNCEFNKTGNYLLQFFKYSEACAESLKLKYKYAYCAKKMELNFGIGDYSNPTSLMILLIVLCFTTLWIGGFILYLCVVTKGCRENKLKTRSLIDKNDKKKLYMLEEKESKGNKEEKEEKDEKDSSENAHQVYPSEEERRKINHFNNSSIPQNSFNISHQEKEGSKEMHPLDNEILMLH